MKKRIVYFLCERGLFHIAEKISPSLVASWRGKTVAEGFMRGIHQVVDAITKFGEGMQEVFPKEEKSTTEHKCNGCKYAGEHQEMMFKPMGVCTREINLAQAVENYNAERCPYDFLRKEMNIKQG